MNRGLQDAWHALCSHKYTAVAGGEYGGRTGASALLFDFFSLTRMEHPVAFDDRVLHLPNAVGGLSDRQKKAIGKNWQEPVRRHQHTIAAQAQKGDLPEDEDTEIPRTSWA